MQVYMGYGRASKSSSCRGVMELGLEGIRRAKMGTGGAGVVRSRSRRKP